MNSETINVIAPATSSPTITLSEAIVPLESRLPLLPRGRKLLKKRSPAISPPRPTAT